MERLSHLGAYMQLKVATFFGLVRDFKEFWAVVVPRLPPPGTSGGGHSVQHTQLYLYLTYDAAVPTSKLWTDGAQMFAQRGSGPNQLFVMVRPPMSSLRRPQQWWPLMHGLGRPMAVADGRGRPRRASMHARPAQARRSSLARLTGRS